MLEFMHHEVTIRRQTISVVDGEDSLSWADDSTGNICSIQEKRGKVEATEGGVLFEYEAVAFFPPETDVRPRGSHEDNQHDELVVTSSPGGYQDGARFQVIVVADTAGAGTHQTAYLRRLPKST